MQKYDAITPANICNYGTQYAAKEQYTVKDMYNCSNEVFFKIIVPNYNNMPYIKKCLDSVLNQTFQDFKIIVVDDLSTDKSDKFCEMYARQHKDKICYRQLDVKGYAGTARNVGLDYPIECRFILFIDSDDWLYNDNVLQDLHDAILSSNKDVKLVKMPMYHFYGENNKKNYIHSFNNQLTSEYAFYRGCGPGRTCISSDLAKCKFKEKRRIANDVIWSMKCIDSINECNLLKIDFPVQTYNCTSITSGTNTIKKDKKSKEYIESMSLFVQDLKNEKFNTTVVKNIQKNLINHWSKKFNNSLTSVTYDDSKKNSLIDASICFDARYLSSSSPNLIHVLVVNFGDTTNFTKQVICDLIAQNAKFDLTIIDNNSEKLELNLKYYQLLQQFWKRNDCSLHIIGLNKNIPLNHLWNYFVENTSNQWLCFLNNDVCIPYNFISDNIAVISKEKNAGIISHATNNLQFKATDILDYKIYDKTSNNFLHRQGWDFTIRRDLYTKIPEEFTTFVGDNIQFNGVYSMQQDVIFLYSSPIIHWCSRSSQKNLQYYREIFQKEKSLFRTNKKYQPYGNENFYDFDHSLSQQIPNNIDQLKKNVYTDNNKKIIVSMTTWKKRIFNIPIVLRSILKQTKLPDKIVINLAKDEFANLDDIPSPVKEFIENHLIELNIVDENTKVYKKIIPTMLKYKNDLVLSIDDDFIYPPNMINDFYETYKLYPNQPISGNRITKFGMACHCGCASLVQYKFYAPFIENYLNYYEHCPSSDLFFTIVAEKNGYTYARTKNEYFNNMEPIPDYKSIKYSKNSLEMIEDTYNWLSKAI